MNAVRTGASDVIRAVVIAALLAAILAATLAASAQTTAEPRGELRIAVFGDFNGPYGSIDYPPLVAKAVDALVTTWRPDLVLSPGDVIAGQSRALNDEQLAAMWSGFDAHIAGRLRDAGIPYAVALGNHDGSSLVDAAGEYLFARDRQAAADYWGQPQYTDNLDYLDRSRYPFDYSFAFGEIAIVVIDASSAHVTAEQRQWLTRQLESAAAQRAAMRIVVGHLPLLPVSQGRDAAGEYLAEGPELARELRDAGVDLYVSGHHAAFYAGTVAGVEALFAGGVGGRRLLAGAEPARSTLTLVDIWFEPLRVEYRTIDLATMQIVVNEALPAAIESQAGSVERSARIGPMLSVSPDGP